MFYLFIYVFLILKVLSPLWFRKILLITSWLSPRCWLTNLKRENKHFRQHLNDLNLLFPPAASISYLTSSKIMRVSFSSSPHKKRWELEGTVTGVTGALVRQWEGVVSAGASSASLTTLFSYITDWNLNNSSACCGFILSKRPRAWWRAGFERGRKWKRQTHRQRSRQLLVSCQKLV